MKNDYSAVGCQISALLLSLPITNLAHTALSHRCFLVYSLFAVAEGLVWKCSSICLVLLKQEALSKIMQDKREIGITCCSISHWCALQSSKYEGPVILLHSSCQASWQAAWGCTWLEFKSQCLAKGLRLLKVGKQSETRLDGYWWRSCRSGGAAGTSRLCLVCRSEGLRWVLMLGDVYECVYIQSIYSAVQQAPMCPHM